MVEDEEVTIIAEDIGEVPAEIIAKLTAEEPKPKSLREQEWDRVREVQVKIQAKQKEQDEASTVEERDKCQAELQQLCRELTP